jgi:putative thioredoxin
MSSNDASAWISEANSENFGDLVIEQSYQKPVIVDFWADWCEPCQMLAPVLEKVIAEFEGQILLVKAEAEKLPERAEQFQATSLPALYAVKEGEIHTRYNGAIPEETIREWFKELLPTEAEKLLIESRQKKDSDAAHAESCLQQAIELDPKLYVAQIELGQIYFETDRYDECQALLDKLEKRGYLEEPAENLKAKLTLACQSEDVGDIAELKSQVEADPKNFVAQIQLAQAYAAAGEDEEALKVSLKIIQTNFGEYRNQAKDFMLNLFKKLGSGSPLTSEYQRKLSISLY